MLFLARKGWKKGDPQAEILTEGISLLSLGNEARNESFDRDL